MKSIIKEHFISSSDTIKSLVDFSKEIEQVVKIVENCKKNKKKILVGGNGGSAADAEHFVGELTCTFDRRDRSAYSAYSLSNSTVAMSAWCNDFEFNSFYERQIIANGNKGDVLILLSTGGGNRKKNISMNLVNCAETAKRKGLKLISFVGKEGGILKKISDIPIHVKSFNTAIIQEAHMSILHCVCICLDKKKR